MQTQAATELLWTLILGLLVFVPLMAVAYQAVLTQSRLNRAVEAVKKVTELASILKYADVNTYVTTSIFVPYGLESASTEGKMIVLHYSDLGDVYAYADTNLFLVTPLTPGVKRIILRRVENGVEITVLD